jgi:outer membrane protein
MYFWVFILLFQWSLCADAGDFFDDPLDTGSLVGPSAGKQANSSQQGDPCLTTGKNPEAWTLLEIIDQALCHNPQTWQAWASARVQAAQVGNAKTAYLPTISLSVPMNESKNSSSVSSSGGAGNISGSSVPLQSRATPTASLSYLLYDFGGRNARLDNALFALEAANWNQNVSIQNVMFGAVQAYYQMFAAQSAAEAALISWQTSDEILKATQLRHEVGAVAISDVLQAQTAATQAKLTLQQAEGNARISMGALATAMGMDAGPKLRVATPDYQNPDNEREQDVNHLIDQAKSLRPDLAAAAAQIKAAEANIRAAEATGMPQISMSGTYGYNISTINPTIASWTLGLQISMPLFNGFSTTYQVHSAKEQVALQAANRDQLEQTVSQAVWTGYHSMNTARETLRTSLVLLDNAEQNEGVLYGRYKAGAGNIIDLLNAQVNLANARVQLVQSRYNWSIAKAQLAQAIGRLDLDELMRDFKLTSGKPRS